ncbi:FAD-dependent oxidoreductase, partial [Stenotrophomonas maltophilia]
CAACHGVDGNSTVDMYPSIAGQSERLDVFQRLRHAPFPGGRLLRTPLLVAAMSWYKLRDALW